MKSYKQQLVHISSMRAFTTIHIQMISKIKYKYQLQMRQERMRKL